MLAFGYNYNNLLVIALSIVPEVPIATRLLIIIVSLNYGLIYNRYTNNIIYFLYYNTNIKKV